MNQGIRIRPVRDHGGAPEVTELQLVGSFESSCFRRGEGGICELDIDHELSVRDGRVSGGGPVDLENVVFVESQVINTAC